MGADMKSHVINLLETYLKRERQINLLHYEMRHMTHVTPEEMIGGMSLGHGDSLGSSGKGRVSDKTMYIALNYQERMEHLNNEYMEHMNEIADRLLELESEQDRIRHYISLLEKREANVLRSFYIEDCSWEEISAKIGVALRTVHKIKSRAIEHLVELYNYAAGLN